MITDFLRPILLHLHHQISPLSNNNIITKCLLLNVKEECIYQKKYYLENVDNIKAAARANYESNPDNKLALSRAYYDVNVNRKKAAVKALYYHDPEKKRAAVKSLYLSNPDEFIH